MWRLAHANGAGTVVRQFHAPNRISPRKACSSCPSRRFGRDSLLVLLLLLQRPARALPGLGSWRADLVGERDRLRRECVGTGGNSQVDDHQHCCRA